MPEPTKSTEPLGPVKRDPLNPAVEIPVYAGGEGPVPMPQGGDRGDLIEPSTTDEKPNAVPQGSVATAVAESQTPPDDGASDEGAGGDSTDAAPDSSETEDSEAQNKEPSDSADKKAGDRPRNEKGQFIPRSRFNEVNEERKRLQEELDQIKAQKGAVEQVQEDAYDFDAKEKEYANLVLDGKIDEAIALRKEIRAAEQAQFERLAARKTVETTHHLTVKQRVDQITEQYETSVPQFDPESDEFNEELLNDVRDFYDGALHSGRFKDAAEAFHSAIKKALAVHGIPDPTEEPEQKPEQKPRQQQPPRTAQKRVEAIVNQPPTLAKTGTSGAPESHATIDINEVDVMALPEATRRRLRGDMI